MNTLQHALVYLARGWSVFPLRQRGKEPFPAFPVSTFQRLRLPAQNEVCRWWHMYPNANIAIATGAISGLFVVDCDSRQACLDVEKRGIPRTLISTTGKGAHIYFRYPEFQVGNRAKLLPGVDVRGTGGYVVAPPSIHPSGRSYAWHTDAPIADAPMWLLKALEPRTPTPTALPKYPMPQSGSAFASVALNREMTCLLDAPEGERNNQLNRAAFCLGQLVAGAELTDAEVISTLWHTALSVGLNDKEIMPTILSGLNAGKKYPRTRFKRTR